MQLLNHEYGHMLQYNKYGPFAYYRVVGKESLISASMHGVQGWNHDTFWTETWANYLSSNHFPDFAWNASRFPIQDISTFNRLRMLLSILP